MGDTDRGGGGGSAAAGNEEEPRIPRPPSPEALDRLSEAQGLITDEWAPQPPPGDATPPAEAAPEPVGPDAADGDRSTTG